MTEDGPHRSIAHRTVGLTGNHRLRSAAGVSHSTISRLGGPGLSPGMPAMASVMPAVVGGARAADLNSVSMPHRAAGTLVGADYASGQVSGLIAV